MLTNTQSVAMNLGGAAGSGDWRDIFLSRDEIAKVTPADVERVAKAYLKPSNRTLGEFIPATMAPDRAEIPATPRRRHAIQGLQRRSRRAAGRSIRSHTAEH
jgi:zinc protease